VIPRMDSDDRHPASVELRSGTPVRAGSGAPRGVHAVPHGAPPRGRGAGPRFTVSRMPGGARSEGARGTGMRRYSGWRRAR
jgi:hypothetical protein